jgi:hypothetical protein
VPFVDGGVELHARIGTVPGRFRDTFQSARALMVFMTRPSVRLMSSQSASSNTAWMKSLVRRTELLEFWPETVS